MLEQLGKMGKMEMMWVREGWSGKGGLGRVGWPGRLVKMGEGRGRVRRGSVGDRLYGLVGDDAEAGAG